MTHYSRTRSILPPLVFTFGALFFGSGLAGCDDFEVIRPIDGGANADTGVDSSIPDSGIDSSQDRDTGVDSGQCTLTVELCNNQIDDNCNGQIDEGCNIVGDPNFFKASNTHAGMNFGGLSLSNDGNTLSVGASLDKGIGSGVNRDQTPGDTTNGAVFVFRKNGNTWSQQAYIKAANPEPGGAFGTRTSLSADGNVLAVAALGLPRARVYLYRFAAGTWQEEQIFNDPDQALSAGQNYFGSDLALSASGDDLVVGSMSDNSLGRGINHQAGGENGWNNGGARSGAAIVYHHSGNGWTREAYIKASNANASSFFGSSVSISANGNRIAVGAFHEANYVERGIIAGDFVPPYPAGNPPARSESGAAYVFVRQNGVWSQEAFIKPASLTDNESFGQDVALNAEGTILAVGSPGNDSGNTDPVDTSLENSGAVFTYIFSSNSGWSEGAFIRNGTIVEREAFGGALAIDNAAQTLVVGSPQNFRRVVGGVQDPETTGGVSVFARNNAAWTFRSALRTPNLAPGDKFGAQVAIDGLGQSIFAYADDDSNAVGIGGIDNNDLAPGSGAVYLFPQN